MSFSKLSDGAERALTALERALRPRDRVFFKLLEDAADNAVEASRLLDRLLREFPDGGTRAQEITACEERGDQLTHEVLRRLDEEFVTPVEPSDLIDLASALDDIVDLIDQSASALSMYKVEAPMAQAQAQALVLVAAVTQVAAAVHRVSDFEDISTHTDEIHRLEDDGDRIVRSAIAALFKNGIDPMVVIRWKDIFEFLEDAIDATERAANVLTAIVLKNV